MDQLQIDGMVATLKWFVKEMEQEQKKMDEDEINQAATSLSLAKTLITRGYMSLESFSGNKPTFVE